MTRRWLFPLAVLVATASCDRGGVGTASARAQTVVDSAVPRAVALERFQAGLAAPESLTGGATSRDALVRAFVRAVEAADTATLRRMTMTKEEFAFLYYPTSPQGLPPYDLAPGLMWTMLELRGRQGLYHLLEQRAGQPLGYAGYSCDPRTSGEGGNRVAGPCVIRRRERGSLIEERLFGLILERDGRFKFVSLANGLD